MTERKTILVSGAAAGIGRAVVEAALALGYDVYAIDIDEAGLNHLSKSVRITSKQGGCLCVMTADVLDTSRIMDFAKDHFKDRRLDLLINNVGAGNETPFYETLPFEWEQIIELSLGSVYNISRIFWKYFRKPGAAIINVSSIHGSQPLNSQAAYATAKGGLENLTRSMAIDAAPYGVRVNTVAPGFVRTERWTAWFETNEAEHAYRRKMADSYVPLGRPGEPSEIAEAIMWLGSSAASYVTGATLPIDGGLSVQAFPRIP